MLKIVRSLLAVALLVTTSAHVAMSQTGPKITSTATLATPANLLDINTATPAQLKALRGVGDAFAKRIVDGRPYTAKNQLTTRGILPGSTYEGIKDQIVARNPRK